jgi:hypothetical protein
MSKPLVFTARDLARLRARATTAKNCEIPAVVAPPLLLALLDERDRQAPIVAAAKALARRLRATGVTVLTAEERALVDAVGRGGE